MPSPSAADHKQKAAKHGPISVAIITVSDTRTPETDVNGKYLRDEIVKVGHHVHSSRIVSDDPSQVEVALEELAAGNAQVLLLNGGTGISRRDTTFDVINRKLDRVLPGFGELFRMLSYDQVGAAAMLSRATAGIYHGKIVFSTPGSPAAVQLAWEKLIAPELQHLTWELVR